MKYLIYDAKTNTLYEAWYNSFYRYWNLYYEDREVMVEARTKKDIELDTKHLFMVGEL